MDAVLFGCMPLCGSCGKRLKYAPPACTANAANAANAANVANRASAATPASPDHNINPAYTARLFYVCSGGNLGASSDAHECERSGAAEGEDAHVKCKFVHPLAPGLFLFFCKFVHPLAPGLERTHWRWDN